MATAQKNLAQIVAEGFSTLHDRIANLERGQHALTVSQQSLKTDIQELRSQMDSQFEALLNTVEADAKYIRRDIAALRKELTE